MADPHALAAAARQVAEFAAAAAAAGDDPAARAAVVRRWPDVRRLLGAPDPADAELATTLAAAADHARPAGLMARARKLLGGSTPDGFVNPDLLTRAARRLRAGGLAADLDTLVAGWKADDAVVRLAALQDQLAAGPAGDVLDKLSVPADGAFATLAPTARTAARTARLIAAALAERSADAEVWHTVQAWVADWFRAVGITGELTLAAPPTADDIETVEFALRRGERAVLWVRPPPPPPRSPLAVWADLPPPPTWPGAPAPAWLVEFHTAARRADADPAVAPPSPGAVKTRFARWVEDDEAGRRWFHAFLADAARDPAGAAAGWWRQVRAGNWCRAFPDLDPGAALAGPTWPADVLPTWPGATSAASDRPLGEVVAVGRYAATPGHAEFVLSDGPAAPDSRVDRLHSLVAAVGAAPEWWGEGRWEAAREAALAEPPPAARAAELALRWLDLLTDAPTDDLRVAAFARWAHGFHLTLVRPTEVTAEPRPGLTVRAVFADAAPGAFVCGSGYGLVAGETVLREAVAEVSLGRAPDGFEALEAAAMALPAGHALRDRAATLREAVRGGYLMEAASRLYVDAWAEPAAAAFAEALTRFLTTAYELTPFSPVNQHDHPDDWVKLVPGSRSVTGRVRRVCRPGLKDDHDNIRIPALVEVE